MRHFQTVHLVESEILDKRCVRHRLENCMETGFWNFRRFNIMIWSSAACVATRVTVVVNGSDTAFRWYRGFEWERKHKAHHLFNRDCKRPRQQSVWRPALVILAILFNEYDEFVLIAYSRLRINHLLSVRSQMFATQKLVFSFFVLSAKSQIVSNGSKRWNHNACNVPLKFVFFERQ